MDFKISEAICAGDQPLSDVQQDFLYKVDQWRKSSLIRKTSRSSRKNIQLKKVPDQRSQPYIPKTKTHHPSAKVIRTMSISAPKANLLQSSVDEKPEIKISQFPKFNLVNELPPQLIPISRVRIEPSKPTIPPKSIPPPKPATDPKSKGILNPILKLIDSEIKVEILEQQKITEQIQKREEHNLAIQPNYVLPTISQNTDNSNSSETPLLLSDDIYYNKFVDHGQWSVIWDITKISNIPLILDRSDKYISFTDGNNGQSGQQNTVREWNNLDLLNPKTNYYSPMQSLEITNEDQNIHNSDAATSLELVEPNITDFEHFHHPAYDAPLNMEIVITHLPNDRHKKDESNFLAKVEDLSAKHGDVYIIEHTVENPSFILNVGMNSLLITYWFKESENDIPKINDDFKTLKILEPNENSPFTAQLPRNKPIQSIYCPLYRMPIAKHKLNETDFLLVKDRFSNKFYVRPFNSIFCAGMLEPQKEVMTPSSKKTQQFQENFMNAIIINIFRGTPEIKKRDQVQVTQIQHSYFPEANDQKLRKILKKYAEFYREQGNGFWKFPKKNANINLDNDFNQLEVTPEKVCRYQSMLVGKWRLRKHGVNLLTSSPRLYMQIKKLEGERTKLIAQKIELELMKAPWAKTSNFTGAFQSNAIEMENADGEIVVRKKSRRQKIENPEAAQQNKKKLVGTRADLRTLSLADLDQNLLQFGVKREDLKNMTRWQKVGVLRDIQTRKSQDNPNEEDNLIYARGSRNGYKESLKRYKQQYQTTFESNLNFISTQDESSNQDNEDFDDGNILDELELELMHNNEQSNEDDDEDIDEDLFGQTEKEKEKSAPQKPKFQSTGDPKELVPYGICTYPTKIDWAAYGFDPKTTTMKPVVKLIKVSLTDTGVEAKVEWIRSQQQIEETRKKPTVFTDIGLQVLNFEESILAERKKKIQDKLRRRNQKKSKNEICSCLGYIPKHTFLLVDEDSNGQFRFQLKPDVVKEINEAREKYENYKKSNHNYESGFKPFPSSSNTSSKPSQPQKRKASHVFNDELKKIIDERGKDLFPQFYPNKDPAIPSLKALATKAEKHEFKNSSDFMNSISEFKSYYKDKDPSASKKADELYIEFKSILDANSIIFKYEQHRKKNAQAKKNAQKNHGEK